MNVVENSAFMMVDAKTHVVKLPFSIIIRWRMEKSLTIKINLIVTTKLQKVLVEKIYCQIANFYVKNVINKRKVMGDIVYNFIKEIT